MSRRETRARQDGYASLPLGLKEEEREREGGRRREGERERKNCRVWETGKEVNRGMRVRELQGVKKTSEREQGAPNK